MAATASTTTARQLAFPELSPVPEAVRAVAAAGIEERGAFFTPKIAGHIASEAAQ